VTVGGVPVAGSPSSDDIPFHQKLFVGGQAGPFAMRGFDYQGLGPHQGDEAIGGELAWVASFEALYPILSRYNPFRGKEETTLKGVAFLDVGNLLPDRSDGLFDDFRVAAGAGIRLRLPALGIAATEDGSTPPDLVRETVMSIPGAQFHLMRRAGHMACVEQPEDYAGAVTGFLRAIGHI